MARPSRSPLLPIEALTEGPATPEAGADAARGGVRRLAVAGAAVLLAAADTYVVVLALPSIMRDVGLSLDQLQQAAPIVSGFLCGYVVVLPLLGRLSDLYGRRPVLLGCLAVFALGSAVTASAHTLGAVVVGRTLQGLGGGGLVPVTLALVADTWPPQRRGVPLGVVGAVQELGSVIGPLYGAAIVAVSSWRTIFWVNLPVAMVLAAGFRPAAGETARRSSGRTGRADLAGGVLLAAAAAAALLALLQPDALATSDSFGQLYSPLLGSSALTTPLALAAAGLLAAFVAWELAAPWGVRPLLPLRRTPALLRAADWPGALLLGAVLGCVIVAFAGADPSRQVVGDSAPALLAVAAAAAVLFLLLERRRDDPLVPFAALRHPAAYGALLVNLCAGAALMAALVDVPLFARATRFPDSQVQAALVLVRFLAAVPVGAVLGGLVCERLSHRVTAGFGMLLSAGMFLLLGGWTAGTLGEHAVLLGWHAPLGGADLELALCGLGFGLAIAPVNAAVLGAVRGSLHGLASALVVVARMVGMLVGLAALTAVGLRRFYAASAHIPSPVRLCPHTPAHCPAYDRLATAAVVDELHAVFFGAGLCAAAAAVLALVLLQRPAGGERVSLGEVLAGG
ncbi:MAG: Major facilitator superfamily 1 [Chloroflexi bacterium]|nr:Major facilitator superfamily 1 [Chloroflexota bacterium]